MRLLYVVNARIPTEKAHGIAIMKACEAFADAGVETTLVAAARVNVLSREDPYAFYNVRKDFSLRRLPSLDIFSLGASVSAAAYVVQAGTFYVSLFFYLFFRSRSTVVYTREAPAAWLAAALGFPAFLECHFIPERRRPYLAFARKARGIVAVASTIREQFLREGFEGTRILAQPNAVDLSIFAIDVSAEEARRRLGLPADAFILGYTGNFTTRGEDKGLDDALSALVFLPPAFRLVAVGGRPNDIERYQALAVERGVERRAEFIGYRSQADLALYQKASDVLIMPFPGTPYYREHMSPLKAFEYAAACRPIIATDLPTIREVLDDATACIIPADNPEALARAATALREDSSHARAIAKAAYERVARTHSWGARAQNILTFVGSR